MRVGAVLAAAAEGLVGLGVGVVVAAAEGQAAVRVGAGVGAAVVVFAVAVRLRSWLQLLLLMGKESTSPPLDFAEAEHLNISCRREFGVARAHEVADGSGRGGDSMCNYLQLTFAPQSRSPVVLSTWGVPNIQQEGT